MKLLSFCIPTFNRGETIQATLESICRQYNNSLEIIIYDSGQDELTSQVVHKYKAQYPNIHYIHSGKRAGIDKDIENTLSLASGKYSWLLSSDDALVAGAVRFLIEKLQANHDIYLCNRIVCNHKLAPIKNRSWLCDNNRTLYDFKNREELLSYLIKAREMGAIFSYMSSLIIKNATWQAAPDNSHNYGSCYAHIIKLFGILLNGGLLKYIDTPLVLNRSFNDSFLENGILNRFLIDFRGIPKIAKTIFPDDSELQHRMVNLMILEHPWYQLLKVKSYTNDHKIWIEIKNGLKEYGYEDRTISFIEKLGKYRKMVRAWVKIKMMLNKHFARKYFYLITQNKLVIK